MVPLLVRRIKSFLAQEKGGVLVLVSLFLLPLFLMLGLAVDSSFGLAQKRKLQMACDAAAKAGAVNGNGQTATVTSEAQKVFTANTANMTGITGPTVSLNSTSGAVTVSASISVHNTFMTLGGIPTSAYSATATAFPNAIQNAGCIYALDPSANNAVSFSGGAAMNMTGCGVYANSSSSSAVFLSGGSSKLSTQFLKIVGNYTTSGGATITATQGITTGATPTSNPLGSIAIPSYSSCNFNNFTASSSQTINPGVYCNGIKVQGGATLTLNPGQYIIDGGSLTVNSSTLTGSNVTIILTKKLTSSYATLTVSGGSASATLSAPTGNTSNPFNGIALYQDPNAPSGVTNNIQGGATFNVSGIISFSNQILNFSGGSSSNAPCTILIADQLSFSGGSNISCTTSLLNAYMAGR